MKQTVWVFNARPVAYVNLLGHVDHCSIQFCRASWNTPLWYCPAPGKIMQSNCSTSFPTRRYCMVSMIHCTGARVSQMQLATPMLYCSTFAFADQCYLGNSYCLLLHIVMSVQKSSKCLIFPNNSTLTFIFSMSMYVCIQIWAECSVKVEFLQFTNSLNKAFIVWVHSR